MALISSSIFSLNSKAANTRRRHNAARSFAQRTCAVRGFTLVEMLVALVVIAVVGISISSAIGGVADQTYKLERRTIAHWVGQNQLHRLRMARRASNDAIPEGKDSTRVLMGNRDWEVRTSISGTDHPWMRRVEVEVFELQDGDRVGPFATQVAFVGQY